MSSLCGDIEDGQYPLDNRLHLSGLHPESAWVAGLWWLALQPGPLTVRRYGTTRKRHPRMEDLVLERSLQETIRQAASLHKWLYYHTHDSRNSPSGFPDCTLLSPGPKPRRLVFWELKRTDEHPDASQRVWLDALQEVEGPPLVEVIRPEDLDRCLLMLKKKNVP